MSIVSTPSPTTSRVTTSRVTTSRAVTGRAAASRALLTPVRPAPLSRGPVDGPRLRRRPGHAGLVLTPRGRRLARLLVLAAATVVLAVGLVLAWVAVAATVAPGASAGDGTAGVVSGAGLHAGTGTTVVVVVAPGDTLWQLAREHAPDRDPRSVVAEIVTLNGLGSADVQAGAEVLIPLR